MLESMRISEPQYLGRKAWDVLISESGTSGYLVTLGFRKYLDLDRSIDLAETFLLRMNRRLFGKRFKDNRQFLQGMVILERKRRSTHSPNSPHFHFVVSAKSFVRIKIIETELRSIAEDVAGRLRYPTLEPVRPFGEIISGPDFVDVRGITSADFLANYLTKDCHRFGPAGDALNIGFLCIGGIEGLATT